MDKLGYLEGHHEITEAAIGLARVALGRGAADKAKEILDRACDELDALQSRRRATVAAER